MTTNLKLHLDSGGQTANEGDVRAVATPGPTDTHFPIPHETLLDEARRLVASHDLTIVNEGHALAHKGDRYFGLMEVAPAAPSLARALAITDGASHTDGLIKPDFATIIGLRNSHDKAFSAGLCVGSQVFVCDNLAFSGEVTMRRKHSRHILRDLPALLEAAMGKLMGMRAHQDLRIQAYKDTEIDNRTAHDLMVRGMRAGVVPSSKLTKVVDEWERPSHEDFEARTTWSLFNAFTEVLKSRGQIWDKPRFTQALHGLMDSASGVAPMVLGTTEVEGGEVQVHSVLSAN
jgi:hypothetical protein